MTIKWTFRISRLNLSKIIRETQMLSRIKRSSRRNLKRQIKRRNFWCNLSLKNSKMNLAKTMLARPFYQILRHLKRTPLCKKVAFWNTIINKEMDRVSIYWAPKILNASLKLMQSKRVKIHKNKSRWSWANLSLSHKNPSLKWQKINLKFRINKKF